MCGRFCIAASPGEVSERYETPVPSDYTPRFNISPGQDILTISGTDMTLEARMTVWGFQSGLTHRVINARVETIHEKALFNNLFPDHRCLVPASGYFEWKHDGNRKNPYYFTMQPEILVSFAGLIRPLKNDREVVILTTRAVPPASGIHDRMPVILNPPDERKFLETGEISMTQKMFAMHKVSTRVNSVHTDGPDLIKSWKPRSIQQSFGDPG
jgi:putative SOS response-associated peptidase YedK